MSGVPAAESELVDGDADVGPRIAYDRGVEAVADGHAAGCGYRGLCFEQVELHEGAEYARQGAAGDAGAGDEVAPCAPRVAGDEVEHLEVGGTRDRTEYVLCDVLGEVLGPECHGAILPALHLWKVAEIFSHLI